MGMPLALPPRRRTSPDDHGCAAIHADVSSVSLPSARQYENDTGAPLPSSRDWPLPRWSCSAYANPRAFHTSACDSHVSVVYGVRSSTVGTVSSAVASSERVGTDTTVHSGTPSRATMYKNVWLACTCSGASDGTRADRSCGGGPHCLAAAGGGPAIAIAIAAIASAAITAVRACACAMV